MRRYIARMFQAYAPAHDLFTTLTKVGRVRPDSVVLPEVNRLSTFLDRADDAEPAVLQVIRRWDHRRTATYAKGTSFQGIGTDDLAYAMGDLIEGLLKEKIDPSILSQLGLRSSLRKFTCALPRIECLGSEFIEGNELVSEAKINKRVDEFEAFPPTPQDCRSLRGFASFIAKSWGTRWGRIAKQLGRGCVARLEEYLQLAADEEFLRALEDLRVFARAMVLAPIDVDAINSGRSILLAWSDACAHKLGGLVGSCAISDMEKFDERGRDPTPDEIWVTCKPHMVWSVGYGKNDNPPLAPWISELNGAVYFKRRIWPMLRGLRAAHRPALFLDSRNLASPASVVDEMHRCTVDAIARALGELEELQTEVDTPYESGDSQIADFPSRLGVRAVRSRFEKTCCSRTKEVCEALFPPVREYRLQRNLKTPAEINAAAQSNRRTAVVNCVLEPGELYKAEFHQNPQYTTPVVNALTFDVMVTEPAVEHALDAQNDSDMFIIQDEQRTGGIGEAASLLELLADAPEKVVDLACGDSIDEICKRIALAWRFDKRGRISKEKFLGEREFLGIHQKFWCKSVDELMDLIDVSIYEYKRNAETRPEARKRLVQFVKDHCKKKCMLSGRSMKRAASLMQPQDSWQVDAMSINLDVPQIIPELSELPIIYSESSGGYQEDLRGAELVRVIAQPIGAPSIARCSKTAGSVQLEQMIEREMRLPAQVCISDLEMYKQCSYLQPQVDVVRAAERSPDQQSYCSIVQQVVRRVVNRVVTNTQNTPGEETMFTADTRFQIASRILSTTRHRGVPWNVLIPTPGEDRAKVLNQALLHHYISVEICSGQIQRALEAYVLYDASTDWTAGDIVLVKVTRRPPGYRLAYVVGADGGNFACKYGGVLHLIKPEDITGMGGRSMLIPQEHARNRIQLVRLQQTRGKWKGKGIAFEITDAKHFARATVAIEAVMAAFADAGVLFDSIRVDPLGTEDTVSVATHGGRSLLYRLTSHTTCPLIVLSAPGYLAYGRILAANCILWQEPYAEVNGDETHEAVMRFNYRVWVRGPLAEDAFVGKRRRVDDADASVSCCTYFPRMVQPGCQNGDLDVFQAYAGLTVDPRAYQVQSAGLLLGSFLFSTGCGEWQLDEIHCGHVIRFVVRILADVVAGSKVRDERIQAGRVLSFTVQNQEAKAWLAIPSEEEQIVAAGDYLRIGDGDVCSGDEDMFAMQVDANSTARNAVNRCADILRGIGAVNYDSTNTPTAQTYYACGVQHQVDTRFSLLEVNVVGIPDDATSHHLFAASNAHSRGKSEGWLLARDGRIVDDIGAAAGRFMGDDLVSVLEHEGDLSWNKTVCAVASVGTAKVCPAAEPRTCCRVLWDSGARGGPRTRVRETLKIMKTGLLRERQAQVHNIVQQHMFDALRAAGGKVTSVAGRHVCSGIGGETVTHQAMYVTGSLLLCDYETGLEYRTPTWEFFLMDIAADFDCIIGARPLREIGGIRCEDPDEPFMEARNLTDIDGRPHGRPVKVSNWVYRPAHVRTPSAAVQAAYDEDREQLTSWTIEKSARVMADRMSYRVRAPFAQHSIVRFQLPPPLTARFFIEQTPPIAVLPKSREVEITLLSKDGVRAYPRQLLLKCTRMSDGHAEDLTSDLITESSVSHTDEGSVDLAVPQNGSAHTLNAEGRCCSDAEVFAAKYKKGAVQRPNWTPERFAIVLDEDRAFRAATQCPHGSAKWALMVAERHYDTTDANVVQASAILANMDIAGYSALVREAQAAISHVRRMDFQGQGHKLGRMRGGEIGLEDADLLRLPEVQLAKFDSSSKRDFHSRVENILFGWEVAEGAVSDTQDGIRILNKGYRADRAKIVAGRIAWDVRLHNMITPVSYCLLTNPADVHAYLKGTNIAAYGGHDVAGAFRNIAIRKQLQPLLGLQVGNCVGKAIVGTLGMPNLGSHWTKRVYPAIAGALYSSSARQAFWEELKEAWLLDVARGRSVEKELRATAAAEDR